MKHSTTFIAIALGLILFVRIADLAARPTPSPAQAAVASAHPAATAVGQAVLAAGGNAFDAAVAVTAALAVVEPYSSGIGGGGFYLIHRASDAKQTMIDARERAPAAATADMYLDASGEFVRAKSLNGALAAGIPGTPAGLVYLAENYGRLPLSESLAGAIALAENGFEVTPRYKRMAGFRKKAFEELAAGAEIFLTEDGDPALGDIIKQADLAETLRLIGSRGLAGFYEGELATKLVGGVRAGGGVWTLADLTDYKVVERKPITFNYGDIRIVSAPPPSSGGVVLAEAFHVLNEFDLSAMDSATQRHVVIEAMRRGYRDRAEYLGDPDHVDIPLERLVSPAYGKQLAQDLSIDKATPSTDLRPIGEAKGTDTTHFSVLDSEGNRVAATLSVNYPFGACYVPAGTGVLLNNEMDDFSARPFTPNAYGLVGVTANAIAPGKRPVVEHDPEFRRKRRQNWYPRHPGWQPHHQHGDDRHFRIRRRTWTRSLGLR